MINQDTPPHQIRGYFHEPENATAVLAAQRAFAARMYVCPPVALLSHAFVLYH